MSDLMTIDPQAGAKSERTELDGWLLALRAPGPAPDLSAAVMAAVREEAEASVPVAPVRSRAGVTVAGGPPPLLTFGALWRPALAIAGAFAAAALALALWGDTAGGERLLPVLLGAVENPAFGWVVGTLLACAAGIAIPMAWMEA